MFSLIIAIISIALVVALVAASGFFGGSAMTDAKAQAEAARLRTEEQQILAGMDLFNADYRRWPDNVQELVTTGYLRSVPKGAVLAVAPVQSLLDQVLPAAFAAADPLGWSTPLVRQPIFWTSAQVPKEVCQKYNLVTRGDDGILKLPFNNLSSQCFGVEGSYTVVVGKVGASIPTLTEALAPLNVQSGGLPDASAGEDWWASAPQGAVTSPVDPDKGALPELVLQGNAALGLVQLGETAKSSPLTLRNAGRGVARNVVVSAPSGFSVVDSSCSSELAASASCNFAVSFTPASAQDYTGSVSVSGAKVAAITVQTAGKGISPSGSMPPVDFGALAAGGTLTRDITVTNTGVGPLTIQSAAVTAGSAFTKVAGGTCGATLNASASCTFKVQLTATAGPTFAGTFTVVAAGGVSISAGLSGEVAAAKFSVTPSSNDFRNVMIGYPVVGPLHTVKNYGTVAGSVVIGALPTGYTLVGSTCAAAVAPNGTCSFSLSFTPTAASLYGGQVALTSAGVNQANVSVSGSGTTASLTLVGTLAFGNVTAGTQGRKNITLRNVSASTIPIPSTAAMVSFSVPGFSVYQSACGSQLTQNGSGNAACLLTIAYDSPGPGAAVSGYMYVDTGIGVLSAPVTATPK